MSSGTFTAEDCEYVDLEWKTLEVDRGSTHTFRIIRINEDGSLRLMSVQG